MICSISFWKSMSEPLANRFLLTKGKARRKINLDNFNLDNHMFYSFFESPVGTLWLVSDGECLTGLHFRKGASWGNDRQETGLKEKRFFEKVTEQLKEYFAGKRTVFDVPLKFEGTVFQEKAWRALLEIPHGETRSYAQQAEVIGSPRAVRAVGTANGQNPISIIVPCHRVI